MQKWVFALPATNETEVKRKEVLQGELERTVADLGDKPGLGGNGVLWHSQRNTMNRNFLLTPSALARFRPHGPPQR